MRVARHRPPRPARSRPVAAAVVAAGLLLAGCGSGTAGGPAPARAGQPEAVTRVLDAAVAEVDRTRKELLDGPGAVVVAATALDDADAACATGEPAPAVAARRTVGPALAAARAAVSAVPDQAAAYRGALASLGAAAGPLEPAQRQALLAVVAAGEDEATSTTSFASAAASALPAFAALDAAQATWVERADADWYRTAAEGAAAYAVLVRPQQQALDAARAALSGADATRRASTERQRTALSAADAALAPLR